MVWWSVSSSENRIVVFLVSHFEIHYNRDREFLAILWIIWISVRDFEVIIRMQFSEWGVVNALCYIGDPIWILLWFFFSSIEWNVIFFNSVLLTSSNPLPWIYCDHRFNFCICVLKICVKDCDYRLYNLYSCIPPFWVAINPSRACVVKLWFSALSFGRNHRQLSKNRIHVLFNCREISYFGSVFC